MFSHFRLSLASTLAAGVVFCSAQADAFTLDFGQSPLVAFGGLGSTASNQLVNVDGSGVDVTISLSADVGSAIISDPAADFSGRDPSGDGAGVTFDISGISSTAQSAKVELVFSQPVRDFTFAMTDIDSGNSAGGASNEVAFFRAYLGSTLYDLNSATVTEINGQTPPSIGLNGNGDATYLDGTGAYFANTVRIRYNTPIDRIVIGASIDANVSNSGTAQTLFNPTFLIPEPSTGLLACLAGCLLGLRRRRR